RLSRIDAGGVFVMNEYDRSAYTVTTAGMIRPSWPAVFALKFLQKSIMFTPCGPSAVPTGGAGVALPAAIWSFTTAVTFFAIGTLHHGGHGGNTKRLCILKIIPCVLLVLIPVPSVVRSSQPVRNP